MANYVFGVDIGGTTVKIGMFTTQGEMVEKWEITTRTDEGGKYILSDIAASVEDKLAEKRIEKSDVAGVGMGVPGPVKADGTVIKCVNLGWGIFNVEEELSKLLALPVKAGNDANMAALGEMWQGGGKGHKDIVMVTLGTGVGGGIILDGKMLAGTNGAGGEIGHVHVDDTITESCNCGNKGCLEQVASATGIARLARKALAADDRPSLMRDAAEVSAKTVFDAVKAGDEVAKEVAETFGKYLGTALAVIAGVVDPQVFVIGGGVSKAGPVLLEYIQKYYKVYAFPSCKDAAFVLATLGNDAGIYGAAKLVLEEA